MVEALLVVAVALVALSVRRLGVLLRRDEAAYGYLEARLEDQVRSSLQQAATRLQSESAASLASLGDRVLAQLAQGRGATEAQLEALADRIVEARRIGDEGLDAIARQAAEDAQRTRRELREALDPLQRSLGEALREMRALHEQTLQELRRPIRHALAIRQEIRRARDERAGPEQAEPTARSESAGSGSPGDATERTPSREVAPGKAPAPVAPSRALVVYRAGPPAALVVQPRTQPEPVARRGQAAVPRRRRLADLLRRVQLGRSRSARPDAQGPDTQRRP